jgi:hypothetical protein
MYERKNVLFDVGLYLVACFYRCGAFGDQTSEQLWDGGGDMFLTRNVDEKNRALFIKPKQGSGLGLKADNLPMTAGSLEFQFNQAVEASGLNPTLADSQVAYATPYSIRRGTATGRSRAESPLSDRTATFSADHSDVNSQPSSN